MQCSIFSLVYAFAFAFCKASLLPNVPTASFDISPIPFTLHVDRTFVADLADRVRTARAPVAVDGIEPTGAEGPTLANFSSIQDHWVNKYDWCSVETSINRDLNQFTTTVRPLVSNHSLLTPLHFVHHRSPRSDAMPLLFVHGWPGSFLEVRHIIDRLTDPPNASLPAFHVVAPSIPGFGFSPAPTHAGVGPTEVGHAFHALMSQLGYQKYVVNGGDLGSVILRFQAASYPDNVVSMLNNFWLIKPNAADLARRARNQTSPDENTYLQHRDLYINERSGYRLLQQTVPLTAAYPLTDSPLGFALYAYSVMRELLDPTSSFKWTPEEIITWAMMYLIQGPYGGLRFYLEVAKEGAFDGLEYGTYPYVHQPVAISEFPYDLGYGLPLDWAQREGNVVRRTVHTHGGHLPAYEVPDLLAHDMWSFFGDPELSGTKVFSPGAS